MVDKKNKIIVNATALDQSGALSILRQFINNIPNDGLQWLIFISDKISITSSNSNVQIEPIKGVKSMYKRLLWDTFGLKKWLRGKNIKPIAALSLQNTGFNIGKKVPQFIYFHQPLPFYPFRWNPLKKQERTFWFYKVIYPFFVKLFLKKDTKIFVQLDFIKDGFTKKFKHSEELIKVYSPLVSAPKISIENKPITTDIPRFLYPAMPYFYKNHRVIEEALERTNAKIEVLFTIASSNQGNGDERIKLIGVQPYESIFELYRTCDALLFPSYIETFGLPLLEAAMTGMPIIATDLPYAREVLEGYEGVTFIPYNNSSAWADAMCKFETGKRYSPIDISERPGWKELFEYIKSSL